MVRYALAGAGLRSLDFGPPIHNRFAATAALIGIYDPNSARAHYLSQLCGGTPVFADFDEMLRQTAPDAVIVTTMDSTHHDYVIRTLQAGHDVIVEKPMTIDAEKCRAILAAERQSACKVTVTFNYRFSPYATRIKELLSAGAIGRVLSVDFEWLLDTRHGADYFRRWHRRLANSGGLLVHKATHHFDIVNWWVADAPQTVFAQGLRAFYGPTRVERGQRCSTCDYQRSCEFYVDLAADPLNRSLYFEAEHLDGYYRDGCVFDPEIDIYDTMSVNVRYHQGVLLTYSLIAHSPYEGWRAAINGAAGRMEIQDFSSGPSAAEPHNLVRVFDRRGEVITYSVPKAEGAHGGSDARLVARLFQDRDGPDPLGHMASSRDGAQSILIGIAANQSIATGLPVEVPALLDG